MNPARHVAQSSDANPRRFLACRRRGARVQLSALETFEVGDGSANDSAGDGATADTGGDDATPASSGATPDLCGMTRTNLKTDTKNCGKCGRACQAGETCQINGRRNRALQLIRAHASSSPS